MVSLETMGGNAARLMINEVSRVGELDDSLITTRTSSDINKIQETIVSLADQLHHLARLESYANGKTLQIIQELHRIHGVLKAKEVNMHNAYKSMKIDDRTSNDTTHKQQLEAEMKSLGEAIRHIDGLIAKIQTVERSVVSDIRQSMSTARYIAQRAEA